MLSATVVCCVDLLTLLTNVSIEDTYQTATGANHVDSDQTAVHTVCQKGSKTFLQTTIQMGAQWVSGRVLDSRPRCRGFKPHRRHCLVVLEQDTFILA